MRDHWTMLARVGCVAAAILVWGCKQTPEPQPPAPAPAPAPQVEASPEGAPAPAVEPAAGTEAKAPQEGAEAANGPEAKPAETAPAQPPLDREKLSACYQEVYCAQKKGEMERILDIYKAHGFETPQDFTKAWIEAAKDTDWITRVANSVAKKCQ